MKTVMSKKRVGIGTKIKSYISLYNAFRNGKFADAKRTIFHHNRLTGYLHKYVNIPVEKARILDIGCGQTARQVVLFHTDGADATGIDIDISTYKISIPLFFKIIRTNGVERAMKSLARHILFDKKFFRELSLEYVKPLVFDNVDVRIMDATKMYFASDSFDLIFSNVVFQHIDNLEDAVKEVNRVLKRSGIAAIYIHLFPSISGGICHEWLSPEQSSSSKVPPWDHLRENKYPVNMHLNKIKLNEYRKIFSFHTNVIEEQLSTEGEQFLTQVIEDELNIKGYTREDLLTRTVLFLVRKKD